MRILRFVPAVLAAGFLIHCGTDSETTEPTSDSQSQALCNAGWNATWQQGSGANEWWVEYTIGGSAVSSAYLEVPGRANVPLSLHYDKWSASTTKITSGTMVVLHATNSAGQSAQTRSFAYLTTAAPASDPCSSSADAGTCSSWPASFAQGPGANTWWVEYTVTGGTTSAAYLQVIGGIKVPLTAGAGKWRGSPSAQIPSGTSVSLHADDASGHGADTTPFRYLVDTTIAARPCDMDGGTTPPPVDSGTDGGTASGDPFDANQILGYEFTFDADAMAVLTDTDPSTEDTWVHGTFKQGSATFADVGFRRKGSSTFRALPQKASLKVKFDKYVKHQTWNGLTDLTLNNSASDPTFIAERLSYYVYRSLGMPAQRAATANVTINGENYGPYANIETPDQQLNDRLFGANAKTLYECDYGSQWLPGVDSGFDEKDGDGSFSDLHALFAAVQNAHTTTLLADVAGVLHTDEWLKFSAIEGAIGDYDGYAFGDWGSHNYDIAGDVNGQFSLIPWSTDLTMSDRNGVVDTSSPKDTSGAGPTLIATCKQSATCWSAYKAQMRGVLTTFESLNLPALARQWHAQVDPFVQADKKTETSNYYYNSESTKLFAWLGARPAVVRGQLGL